MSEKISAQFVSRGVRKVVPNIAAIEVWHVWEKLADPTKDDVYFAELAPHRFSKNTQRIAFPKNKKVVGFRTINPVEAQLVITCFDGEATMMLREEADEIFGENLRYFANAV